MAKGYEPPEPMRFAGKPAPLDKQKKKKKKKNKQASGEASKDEL